jgi:HPt (histidine-containing phosphotransfer) domain-containing protein
MNDFIAKPIDAGELNATLIKWLPPDKVTTVAEVHQNKYSNERKSAAQNENTPSEPAPHAADAPLGEADMIEEFAGIEGFDPAAGLSHVGGNAEAYTGILRQFCNEFENYETEINQYLVSEDWKNYAIKLHAIKGVLATIGHDTLSKWAYKLELAGKAGEADTCKNETEGICAAVRAFRDQLAQSPRMAVEEAGPKTRVESDLVKRKLAALRDACSKGDSDTADALVAELAGMSLDEETDKALEEICGLATNLDYDAAVEKIAALEGGRMA